MDDETNVGRGERHDTGRSGVRCAYAEASDGDVAHNRLSAIKPLSGNENPNMTAIGLESVATGFPDRPRATREAGHLFPLLLGVADGAAGFSYLIGAPIWLWYGALLASKLFALLMFNRRYVLPARPAFLFVCTVVGLILLTGLDGIAETEPYVQSIAFLATLILTLCVVDFSRLRSYVLGAAYAILASSAVHLAMCGMHQTQIVWGRFMYFHGTHPNLGGEICAIGAVASLMSFRRTWALLAISLLFVDTYLMQSRSGMITEAACVIVALLFDTNRSLSPARSIVAAVLATIGLLLTFILGYSPGVSDYLTKLMLVDNIYRGAASGISGRSYLWPVAWDLFRDSPILGHGFGYFKSIDYIGPHNIVLWGLGENGITSLLCIFAVIWAYWIIYSINKFYFAALATVVPLFIFNDRFINLNPYPFILYVALFAACRSTYMSGEPARGIPVGAGGPRSLEPKTAG